MNSKDIEALIVDYREKGMPYRDIADKLHVSSAYARNVFSRAMRKSSKVDQKPNGLCRQCGKPLENSEKGQKRLFCSAKCSAEYHNQKSLRVPFLCVCKYCGHEFVAYGNAKKRYCSRECQTLAGRKG